jgi:hypothetical protein
VIELRRQLDQLASNRARVGKAGDPLDDARRILEAPGADPGLPRFRGLGVRRVAVRQRG